MQNVLALRVRKTTQFQELICPAIPPRTAASRRLSRYTTVSDLRSLINAERSAVLKIKTSTTLYHPPIATIGIVIICLLIGLIALAMGSKAMGEFTLDYDEGLKPLQWFTSPFIQTSIVFLLVDLIFLFAFGMLAEGKMGLPKFLGLFLCIAITGSAIQQFAMKGKPAAVVPLNADGTRSEFADLGVVTYDSVKRKKTFAGQMGIMDSVGASTTIFGLMAVCVLCAPSTIYEFGEDDSDTAVPLLGLAVLFAIWEGLKWFMVGFDKGGLPIHTLGMIPGIVLGVVFIQLNLARCDGEDLLGGAGSSGTTSKKNEEEKICTQCEDVVHP